MKLLFRIALFVFILMLADFVIGRSLRAAFFTSRDINIARLNYVFDQSREDIFILGSSRALHHFVPEIISAETHMTVYNGGFAGQGLTFSFLELYQIARRYTPKKIVLEVSPNILADRESDQKLNVLLPYSQRDSVMSNTLIGNNLSEKIKFSSEIYPFNSLIFDLLYSHFKFNKDSFSGFMPLYARMGTPAPEPEDEVQHAAGGENEGKQLAYMNRIIRLCAARSIKLYLVVSPMYRRTEYAETIIKQLRNSFRDPAEVCFFDYSTFGETYGKAVYFKDNLHLNRDGAFLFSKEVSKLLNRS